MNCDQIEVRITLGDMPSEDAFHVIVPSSMGSTSVGDLMGQLFPIHKARSHHVLDMLDARANPDLPEMYRVLAEMFDTWRAGTSRIDLRTLNGDPLLFSQQASSGLASSQSDHPSSIPVLHLVLDHRLLPLEAYSQEGGNRREMLAWMRGCVLLYFLDKRHEILPGGEDGQRCAHVSTVAKDLSTQGLTTPSSSGERYEITPAGRTYIEQLIRETESYIRRFDKFSDVILGNALRPTEFGTGLGIDMRVQLFIADGIDAFRAVFLLRTYDGTLDAFEDTWQQRICDDKFFDMLLEPALDYGIVPEEDLERAVRAGRESSIGRD